MLTRLRVKGFKNLVDVDVRFGPLTCIAGLNGVGKSNLFDAIRFLSRLADRPLVEAARDVRGGHDVSELFTGGGGGQMEFDVEMLIPREGQDDFGQRAQASATFVRYRLGLLLERGDDDDDDDYLGERIRLAFEELAYIPKSEALDHLSFRPDTTWLDSVVIPVSRRTTFVKTEGVDTDDAVIRLQSDRMRGEDKKQRGGGKAFGFSARKLPRTVLSSAQNAEETRTAVLVRQEMRKWRQLQLEPSALRTIDDDNSPDTIDASGAHIPATLYRLARDPALGGAAQVYARTANRLASLVDGVASVRVDLDPVRRNLRFMMKDRHGLELPASSLSDGTLRFVALAVIEQDPRETGTVCLEEPENGIHPQRVRAIVDLLYDIAVDVQEPVDDANPLRQVIMTTHSPLVAGQMKSEDLIFAGLRRHAHGAGAFVSGLELLGLTGTWRSRRAERRVGRGQLLEYLRASDNADEPDISQRRIKDEMQLELPDVGSGRA